MSSRWIKWFERDERGDEELAASVHRARETLQAAESEWFKRHLAWLQSEVDKPALITENHMAMIQFSARANTFKEVRQHLLSQVESARRLIETVKED